MWHFHFLFVFLAIFVLQQQVRGGPAPISSTLSTLGVLQVVQNALLTSPDFLSAKNQLEAAQLEKKNAFSAFLPSIDLSATHGLEHLEPDLLGITSQSPVVSSATVSVTEKFYDNGESLKRNTIAGYKLKLAEVNFQKKKATTIRSVILTYYRYALSLKNYKFKQKNYEELARLAKLVGNQYHQGLKTKKDYLSFKTKAQRSELDLIESEKTQTQARADLFAAMGLPINNDVQFDENVQMVLPKNDLTTDITTTDLYELKELSLQKLIGDIEVDLSKRQTWPTLNLVGVVTYGSSDYIDRNQTWLSQDSTEWKALVNLEFNLLDWGVRNRNVQIAIANQSAFEQRYRKSLLQAENDLSVFKLEVAKSNERYRLLKELQKMEEDTFKLLERDYRSGQSTYLELTTGLMNLLDAQARGLQADYDQADLYLKWKYYKGRLSEETIVK